MSNLKRDVWLGVFEQKKKQFISEGLSPEEADERASAEVRREIRAESTYCRVNPRARLPLRGE